MLKKEKNIVYVGKVLRQDNWITPSLLCIKGFLLIMEELDKYKIVRTVQTKYGICPYLRKGEGVQNLTQISLYFCPYLSSVQKCSQIRSTNAEPTYSNSR